MTLETAEADDSAIVAQHIVSGPPALLPVVLDIAPFMSKHSTVAGAYVGVSRWNDSYDWLGSILLGCTTSGGTFSSLAKIGIESIIGSATDTLAAGPEGYWDRESTVNISLASGTLSSKDEIDVLNGSNWAVIGSEVIAFQDITLEGDGTYTLSNLLRGLRGTEGEISSHAADEMFMLVDPPAFTFMNVNVSAIGTARYLKAVSSGGSTDDAHESSHTLAGGTLKPFAPCHIEGTRDVSNNITLTWVRRTRDVVRLFALQSLSLLEEAEAYEIDCMDGASVVRTITASTTTCTYTAAQQTTDGLTPGNPVTFKLYQMSSKIGRGREIEVTIP
jgi:hypothetical protein